MKKYRHKITGDWVDKLNDHYYKMQSDGRTIPVRLIEGCNDWEEMQVKNLRKPCVMFSLPELEKLITSRIDEAFNNGYQNYEKSELLNALNTIKRLVPPDYFSGNGA